MSDTMKLDSCDVLYYLQQLPDSRHEFSGADLAEEIRLNLTPIPGFGQAPGVVIDELCARGLIEIQVGVEITALWAGAKQPVSAFRLRYSGERFSNIIPGLEQEIRESPAHDDSGLGRTAVVYEYTFRRSAEGDKLVTAGKADVAPKQQKKKCKDKLTTERKPPFQFDEAGLKQLKAVIDKHPTLNRNEVAKLLGCSATSLSRKVWYNGSQTTRWAIATGQTVGKTNPKGGRSFQRRDGTACEE